MARKRLTAVIRAATAAVRDGHSGAEPAVGCPCQPPDDVDDARADIGIEIDEELLLLLYEVRVDACAQVTSRARRAQRNGATVVRIISLLDIPLLDQSLDHPTRGALVQKQALSEVDQTHRSLLDECLERVTLGDRDVVTADLIAVAELVDANQLGNGGLEGLGVALKVGRRGPRTASCGGRHIVGSDNYSGLVAARQVVARHASGYNCTQRSPRRSADLRCTANLAPMKTVIFACVHNAGRSQMAAAIFNQLADPAKARALSAGTNPGLRVHPEVVTVMREVGVDLADAGPQKLTPELASQAQLLITMGCGDECPVVPGLRRDDWPLEDPKGQPLERVREIRNDIRRRVEALVDAEEAR